EPGHDHRPGVLLPAGRIGGREPRQRDPWHLRRALQEQCARSRRLAQLPLLNGIHTRPRTAYEHYASRYAHGSEAMAFSTAAISSGSSGLVRLEKLATTLPWRSI